MAFDPTKPVEGTEIDAAELRNQFNALKDLSDAQQATIDAQQATITDLQDAVSALMARNP